MYHVLYFWGMVIDGAFSVSYIMIVEYLRSGCSYISIEDVCLRLISLFGCTLTGKNNSSSKRLEIRFEEDACWGF